MKKIAKKVKPVIIGLEVEMKLQKKFGLFFSILGMGTLIIMTVSFNIVSRELVINNEMNKVHAISEEIALHMNSHLIEKTKISKTIASAPIIYDLLEASNQDFEILSNNAREEQISLLNTQWVESENINDPFIQQHLTNKVAQYFKKQQSLLSGEYGEIFLTNKYGVMLASTAKLTTLAHAKKYWWEASYNQGKGRIFLDDRGYDTSSKSVVLGIVVPIKNNNNEIIGILKSNVNIIGSLTDVVQEFSKRNRGEVKICRTNGLVLAELEKEPLSTSVDDFIVKHLQSKKSNTLYNPKSDTDFIVSMAPIEITLGSNNVGFGGSSKSIDHTMGNKDEAWNIVTTLDKESALEGVHQVIFILIAMGIIFILLMILIAVLLGRTITVPISNLLLAANEIGKGNLDTKVDIKFNDEVGSLGHAINQMTDNLKNTMASKDELQESNTQLKEALDNVHTLSGLIPICAECKKIKDDKGYWNQVDEYISKHSDLMFSHGLCSDCEEKLYGDQEWYKKKNK